MSAAPGACSRWRTCIRRELLRAARLAITRRLAPRQDSEETDPNRKTGDGDRPIRYRDWTAFGRRVIGFEGDNAAVIEAMTSRRLVSARRCLSMFLAVPHQSTIWVA